MDTREIIAENLARVRQRIDDAARRAGRSGRDVTLVAVTKNRPVDLIEALLDAGQSVLGENRVQEALGKIERIGDRPEWHLIGHLQRNKAKPAVRHFSLIHSVDSARLLEALDQRARDEEKTVRALLQINVAGESRKSGCAPDEALKLFELAEGLEHVRLEGLMAMAPFFDDPERARPSFRALRQLRDNLAASGLPPERLRHLSMGMSGDFEAAIEEGATMVRVGSALFKANIEC
jgi:pyridoxal phosphate enzyme (YggS family)